MKGALVLFRYIGLVYVRLRGDNVSISSSDSNLLFPRYAGCTGKLSCGNYRRDERRGNGRGGGEDSFLKRRFFWYWYAVEFRFTIASTDAPSAV